MKTENVIWNFEQLTLARPIAYQSRMKIGDGLWYFHEMFLHFSITFLSRFNRN